MHSRQLLLKGQTERARLAYLAEKGKAWYFSDKNQQFR